MENYRKKDHLTDQDIDSFETIEINKIRGKINTKKSPFKRRKLVFILPLLLIALVIGIGINNDNQINPALEDIKLAELKPITLSDLPRPIRGLEKTQASHYQFLSSFQNLNNSITFDDEEDVTGEGQLQLEEIINDNEMKDEAKQIFNDLYENILFLELDKVAVFDEVNEYYFVVNEDGTYTLTMKIEEQTQTSIIEAKTFYLDEEFFYQVTFEVQADEAQNIFKIKYNQDNTKKYQYAKYETADTTVEQYVSVEQLDSLTNVVAINKINDVKHEVIASSSQSQGVIFSTYLSEEGTKISSTEYYNSEGALLKQETGFDTLDLFNTFLTELYDSIESNPDINSKNLADSIIDFGNPETFTIEIPLIDSALALTTEVNATLRIDETTSYNIEYSYKDFLFTKKEATFTSGDTMYHITNNEATDTHVVLTYSALYQVPEVTTLADGSDYYVLHKYMAKYLEAKEGYSIILEDDQYKLLNTSIEGQVGDRIDIDITLENFYINKEMHSTTIFSHTCDIQFENLVFTEIETINQTKTDLSSLYNNLVPTQETLEENYQSIDTSMFQN